LENDKRNTFRFYGLAFEMEYFVFEWISMEYEGWWQQLNMYEKEKVKEFRIRRRKMFLIVWIFRRVRSHGTAIRHQMERKILLIRANFLLEFHFCRTMSVNRFPDAFVLMIFFRQPTNMNISTWIEDLINVNPQIQSEVNFFKHFPNLKGFLEDFFGENYCWGIWFNQMGPSCTV